MTERTHTPGPWRVESGTTLVWGKCNPDDKTTYGMGYPIIECMISPASQWAATKGPTCGEGDANACLISTAPDMLEALKALLKKHEPYHNSIEHAAARVIIAKAEGRA